MNLWLRMLYVLVMSLVKPRLISWEDKSILPMQVWLTDLDSNGHMNNGRFFTHMDLGRFDLLLRSGLWSWVVKTRSVPVLGASQIRYRRPLNLWERYTLQTQIVAWDDKWIFIEQRFLVADKPSGKLVLAALGMVKGCFYDPATKQTVPTSALLEQIGERAQQRALPRHVIAWIAAEDALREHSAASTSGDANPVR